MPKTANENDLLTADDKQRLVAIMDAATPEQVAARVYDYYHDADRADRTSRVQMYLHLGMLAGAVMRAIEGKRIPVTPFEKLLRNPEIAAARKRKRRRG